MIRTLQLEEVVQDLNETFRIEWKFSLGVSGQVSLFGCELHAAIAPDVFQSVSGLQEDNTGRKITNLGGADWELVQSDPKIFGYKLHGQNNGVKEVVSEGKPAK